MDISNDTVVSSVPSSAEVGDVADPILIEGSEAIGGHRSLIRASSEFSVRPELVRARIDKNNIEYLRCMLEISRTRPETVITTKDLLSTLNEHAKKRATGVITQHT